MAFDAAHGAVMLFGGCTAADPMQCAGSGFAQDLWAWNGSTWAAIGSDAAAPPPRIDHALAYDVARDRLFVFGGEDAFGSTLGDAWEWDGATWIDREAVTTPSSRAGYALAYDSKRGATVLFGGFGSGEAQSDTWEFDGTTWSQRTPVRSPLGRSGAAMAFDAASNTTVLFGGLNGQDQPFGDTWEWDGSNWTQRAPVSTARLRLHHRRAVDTRWRTTPSATSSRCSVAAVPGSRRVVTPTRGSGTARTGPSERLRALRRRAAGTRWSTTKAAA
jgi:hypothetical protein